MPRSHPPALRALVRRLVVGEQLFHRGDVLLVGVSGGPDSSALLSVLALLRRELPHGLVACGVDHGLRPEASAELDLAEKLAQRLDVPFLRRAVVVPPGAGIPAKARRARLVALGEAARSVGASAIALGHTADDRAETVLLRILRGAGPRGLAVMPPRSPHPFPADGPFVELVRPLLAARRRDVLAHVARHGIDVAHDPTNDDRAHPRVRLRREVLPQLEELSPSVVRHLNRVADLIGLHPLEGLRARP